jgi:hypothetical protein
MNTWKTWAKTWTRSQLAFFCIVVGILILTNLYAVHRFEVARTSALYWQQQAIANSHLQP